MTPTPPDAVDPTATRVPAGTNRSAPQLPAGTKARRAMLMSETLPHFKEYRLGKRKSPATVRLDLQSLRAFIAIVGDKVVSKITPEQMDNFFTARGKAGLTNSGLNGDLRGLSMYFKWAILREITSINPLAEISAYKVVRRHRFYVPVEEFSALLDAATNRRARIIIACGLYLWQRQGESHLIKMKHLRPVHDERGGRVLTTVPKTNQIDEMPISLRLHEELYGWIDDDGVVHQGWLDYYKESLGVDQLDPEWYLIPQLTRGLFTDRGTTPGSMRQPNHIIPHLPVQKTQSAAKDALRRMGYPATKGEGIHTLRRSGARAYYEILLTDGTSHEGAIRTIMAMLHHSSMSTTEIYLGVTADRAVRDKRISGADMYGERERARAARQDHNVINLDERRRRAE